MIYGTPAYMAPEQTTAVDELINERTDVFLLGGVLYKILTGQPPHTGESPRELVLKARQGAVPPPEEVTEHHIYPKLSELAMKAMTKNQEHRYESALAFKSELESFLQGDWRFELKTFDPDDLIIRQGEPGDRAFIIKEGTCCVFKKDRGVETFLEDLGEGEVFGETAVFTNKPRTASVRAISPVTVLVIKREYFHKHFEQDLGMGYWVGLFVKALAERLKEKDSRVTELESQLRDSGYPVPM
jgi:serine/threonine-protein kinase